MARDPKATPPSSSGAQQGATDNAERRREEEALKRQPEGLIGDTAENRNLTGSSTWETIPEPEQREHRRSTNDTGTKRSSGPSSPR